MRIAIKSGIQPGEYAELVRAGDSWEVRKDGQRIQELKDSTFFQPLGLSRYRLLGLENNEARVIRFADLHRHSDNSLLDGMTQVPEMVERTEYAGALTDHGNMYGFLEYYKLMKAAGKKPILGFEGYMESLDGQLEGRHVILLAKSERGVKNLFKLVSEAYDNFKRKPHVTWAMMRQYHEDVMCLSACLGGVVPTCLKRGRYDDARQAVEKFISIFGKEDFYLEIQRHGIAEEVSVNAGLERLAQEYGLKLVATTDSHYPTKDDAYPHEILLCLQTDKTIDDPRRLRYDGSGYHLQTSEEMEELFRDMPEVLDNTLELADKVNIELKLGDVNLPNYDIPKKYATPMDYLTHLAKKGYQDRFSGTPYEKDPVYQQRFEYEINMIKQMGFASYFIIVWDFINYARKNNIYVGPGRGSAAGSIVAYCLGITDLDPIKYNLLFERFLNPERVSMPDIDTDIEFSRRPEVIAYMTKKYGAENVCRIVTFGTLAAKQVVKDVARCLGMPAYYGAKLSDAIPKSPKMTIQKALDMSLEFKQLYDVDSKAKEIIDIAKRLEGNKRHASQHACGLVCAPGVVSDYLPTSMEYDDETKEKGLTSQVTMSEVEELSLIKMDLLGLKNMGVIHEVIDRIQETRGKENILKQIGSTRSKVRYQDIPLNDRKVYQMLASGNTGAVFQLESPGMTDVIKQMYYDIDDLPEDRLDECFERLIATVALYRPGPMDFIPNYIAGMRDVRNIKYLTPELESILRPTYGTIVYQEEVMQIVQKLAGYTLGRADLVRKGMAKKKAKVLAAEKKVFIYGNKKEYESGQDSSYAPGCIANGIPESVAQEIWHQMDSFGSYAFNRSHAACYAFLAYITAYMKCYWPQEFYTAMLNAFVESSDKVKIYLSQATKLGLKIFSPDINLSTCFFLSEEDGIRFGLEGISGLKTMAAAITDEREVNGSYRDFQELYERMDTYGQKLNKKCVEGLVYAGALNSFTQNKAAILAQFAQLEMRSKNKALKDAKALNQISLFEESTERMAMPDVPMMDERDALEKEQKVLGLYLSSHPTDMVLSHIKHTENYCALELLPEKLKQTSVLNIDAVGLVKNLRCFYTKSGKEMMSFMLENKFVSIAAVVFPDDMKACSPIIHENDVISVQGTASVNVRTQSIQIVVKGAVSEVGLLSDDTKPILVKIRNKMEQEMVLDYIHAHPGSTPVTIVSRGRYYPLKTGVNGNVEVQNYLDSVLGQRS